MKLNITLSKRAIYTLITLGILILLAIGVYSFSSDAPNPGHPLSELEPCAKGETLVSNSFFWECQSNNWEPSSKGMEYTKGYVGIGKGVGHYDDEIKLSVKGALQLNVYTTLDSAPPCTSLTRGTIVFAYDWNEPPYSKMFACLYNVNSYEYVRI